MALKVACVTKLQSREESWQYVKKHMFGLEYWLEHSGQFLLLYFNNYDLVSKK